MPEGLKSQKARSREQETICKAGHLLQLPSCSLVLWSVWLGEVVSGELLMGSVSERDGHPLDILCASSRDASSSGRETHFLLLPSHTRNTAWRMLVLKWYDYQSLVFEVFYSINNKMVLAFPQHFWNVGVQLSMWSCGLSYLKSF